MRLTIKNYKSIAEATIDLRPGLNVLIGPNGSGKTCLLSSLQFVRDTFRLGAAQALARQGGARRVYRHGSDSMSFSLTHPYGLRTYRRGHAELMLNWNVTIMPSDSEGIAIISHESLRIVAKDGRSEVSVFSADVARKSRAQKASIRVDLSKESDFGRDLFASWESLYSKQTKTRIAEEFPKFAKKQIVERVDEPDRSFFPVIAGLDPELTVILDSFALLNEYNIVPDVARESSEQLPYARMGPNGASVSMVIDALTNQRFHSLERIQNFGMTDYYRPNRFLEMRDWRYDPMYPRRVRGVAAVKALESINEELAAAVRPITQVGIETDPTNGKRFVVFRAGDEVFHPDEVSDGTVKWLCLLVSLFVPFSKVYLLEEPENFLHPWMQQRLIAIMREQAKENKTIFFVSSHSATILNASHPEEILIVKNGDSGTQLSTIGDLADVREVLKESDFHLGDLWVSGAIGGVPAGA